MFNGHRLEKMLARQLPTTNANPDNEINYGPITALHPLPPLHWSGFVPLCLPLQLIRLSRSVPWRAPTQSEPIGNDFK